MDRNQYLEAISQQFRVHPICALLGPRQVGKTTLAKQFAATFRPETVSFFDFENPLDVIKFDNPMLLLTPLLQAGNLIIIDEIQMRPDLFPVLRVLVDKYPSKILILGSASRDLLRQSSETLAGRIGYIELPPFSLAETKNLPNLWLRGGFPRSYLAPSDEDSLAWRSAYIKTFLERDLPSLGFNIPSAQMYRFWMMLCHYHGQTLNTSEIATSLNISNHLARKYIDVLEGTFMVRTLQPWFENIGKRQVKAPKLYMRDTGILNALLNIHDQQQLHNFPRLGAFWEGLALEEILRFYKIENNECFFWGTQGRAELDLLIFRGGKPIGFEFKYSDTPRITTSMKTAIEDLKLDHLYVIHPSEGSFPMTENITCCGLEAFISKQPTP
jgi:predicted AAA+ superfamily ATPase